MVRFQRHMYSKMAGNVVSFRNWNITVLPIASQAEVSGGLATNVIVGEMTVKLFRL